MSSRVRVPSPIGDLLLVGDHGGLRELRFADGAAAGAPAKLDAPAGMASSVADAAEQLAAYFAGQRRAFELPLTLAGSPFFLRVWQAVLAIPFGETRTYGELAVALGRPRAARAVGLANGRNPLPIIIPCHRLVGADGALAGYGGGLPRKRWLLEHEARLAAEP